MICLAFDLATRSGVCVGRAGGTPRAWSVDLGKGISDGARFARAIRMAEKYIKDFTPDLVAIEAPVGGREASAFLIGLIACVEGQAHRMGVRVVKYYPASVRHHFLGKALTGRDFPTLNKTAAKKAIKGRVVARCIALGWDVRDGDAGDSAALWDYSCMKENPQHAMTSIGGIFR